MRLRTAASARPYVLSGEDIADDVVERVMARVLSGADSGDREQFEEIAYETVYAEQLRLSQAAPDPRSEVDRSFVALVRRELAQADQARCVELVRAIVARYVREISGHFDRRVYRVATDVMPSAVGALLQGFSLRNLGSFDMDQRILIEGETRTLQALVGKGTVILAPTHVSNLDSLILGSAIHRLGLPPFAYGAGLNLFSNSLIGFFMRNLGAYTVDRRKTDPLYRETLKQYTTALLERGQSILFFPGGTRSRAGAVETHLKKGLLGTAPAAVRHALSAHAPRPNVFVIPCTLSYPLVLEASSLVSDYLRAEGGPQYVELGDEFDRLRRWFEFMQGLRQLDLRVHLRICQPLDWLGNEVDDQGHSLDPHGRRLDPARYLYEGGKPVEDDARDAEYTRMLAARLIQVFRRESLILPTHLVAYVVFDEFRKQSPKTNLFRFLRGLGPERGCSVSVLHGALSRVAGELRALEAQGKLRLHPDIRRPDTHRMFDQALATFATYHPTPVIELVGERIQVGDPELLFYYRNRLDGLPLAGAKPLFAGGALQRGPELLAGAR
jgi:glycerol-3-phosphate O-acyltransferase